MCPKEIPNFLVANRGGYRILLSYRSTLTGSLIMAASKTTGYEKFLIPDSFDFRDYYPFGGVLLIVGYLMAAAF